jgi:hypothetical protein
MKTPHLMSAEQYNDLDPYEQGIVTFLVEDNARVEVPRSNPHPRATPEHERWRQGYIAAMFNELNTDEQVG